MILEKVKKGCDEPLHTITTSPVHFGLVSAFLIKYYGAGCGQTLDKPLGTITTKDRFGLVNVILNIKGEKYIMTDDELAKFLCDISCQAVESVGGCLEHDGCAAGHLCSFGHNGFKDWVKEDSLLDTCIF